MYCQKYRFFLLWLVVFISLSCSNRRELVKITDSKSSSFEINKEYGEDSSLIRLIQPYSDSLSSKIERVIGFSDQKMVKGFPEGLLGNLITDYILQYSKNDLHLEADFCIQNNGGFRAELPQGPITLKTIYEIMPFDNELVILEIDARTMKKLLEYVTFGEAISVSGINIVINKSKNAEAYINGIAFDSTRSYMMATSDYLASGGSDMIFLKNCKKASEPKIKIRDIVIAEIEKKQALNQHISSNLDGRIKIVE